MKNTYAIHATTFTTSAPPVIVPPFTVTVRQHDNPKIERKRVRDAAYKRLRQNYPTTKIKIDTIQVQGVNS